ncbi:MAG: thiamine-monophosphate kinase [Gemmatimonadaceae bacterium]|jgi:thiamine-monophosphate kinase|nr:thiamine-monophosphate kinase [Gemmatimonadaceae bacterium]
MSPEKTSDTRNIDLGPGKEFDIVRILVSELGKSAQHIGDDAAIVEVPAGDKLVISTDTSVDGVHFRREWLNHFEIGYRATAAALSDLAAMAARPLGIVIALTLPEADRVDARALATGIREGASAVLCPIVGGDLSSGKTLSLTITALGGVARPLSRAGAKAGQRVYVTGSLGGPAAALRAWQAGKEPTERDRARFANPIPRIEPAVGLAQRGATSAIDISDGLIADLGHIAAASKVCIEIDVDRIPHVEGVSSLQAANSGEEYEIVVTAPAIDTEDFVAEFGLALTEIGRVVAGPQGVELLSGGEKISAPPGFDHFRDK